MPTITGKLNSFNVQSMGSLRPQIIFTPSSPGAVDPNLLVSEKPVVVSTFTGTYLDEFSVELYSTWWVRPEVHFSVSIRYLFPDGGMSHVDLMPGELRVPPWGGTIAELYSLPANPLQAWVNSDAPPADAVAGTGHMTNDGLYYEYEG